MKDHPARKTATSVQGEPEGVARWWSAWVVFTWMKLNMARSDARVVLCVKSMGSWFAELFSAVMRQVFLMLLDGSLDPRERCYLLYIASHGNNTLGLDHTQFQKTV